MYLQQRKTCLNIYIYKSEPSINRFIKLLIFAFVKQGPFEILKRSLIKKKTDHLF